MAWLPALNSTKISFAPYIINSILIFEILVTIFGLIWMPFVSESVYRAGVIHRNFRIQVRVLSVALLLNTLARYIMIYYRVNDLPLRADDFVIVSSHIIRDALFGYVCGIMGSFALERVFATFFFRWYEQQSPASLFVLLFVETINLGLAFLNATCWILDIWSTTVNSIFMVATILIAFMLFYSVYLYNLFFLRSLTISIDGYSLARTFQIRENVRIMRYLASLLTPMGLLTIGGFSLFGYHDYAPVEWRTSRYIAIALYDVYIALFCLMFLHLLINGDSEFIRQFHLLRPVKLARETFKLSEPIYGPSRLKSVHESKGRSIDVTATHFGQLGRAWQ